MGTAIDALWGSREFDPGGTAEATLSAAGWSVVDFMQNPAIGLSETGTLDMVEKQMEIHSHCC
jgi:hypothetical protein